MAAYYDYIPGAVQWRTPALDPSNECGTFLSYKLTDWANKVGPNYAQIWTNHEEWEASDRYVNGDMTSLDNSYISLRLLGRDYRAGTLPGTGIEPWFGIRWERLDSNDRGRVVHVQRPDRIDTDQDYTRNNLVRDTYGHVTGFSQMPLSDSYYIFDNNDFSQPKITRVLYSDTPGNRYFAWQINGNTGAFQRGCIYEVQPRADLPAGADIGWAITDSFSWYTLSSWNPSSIGNQRFYFNGQGTKLRNQFGPGYSQNTALANPIISSAAMVDFHGDIVGTCSNFYWGSSVFEQNFTYRIGGQKYFAWTDDFLLPID